jgi:hypothetical protein
MHGSVKHKLQWTVPPEQVNFNTTLLALAEVNLLFKYECESLNFWKCQYLSSLRYICVLGSVRIYSSLQFYRSEWFRTASTGERRTDKSDSRSTVSYSTVKNCFGKPSRLTFNNSL